MESPIWEEVGKSGESVEEKKEEERNSEVWDVVSSEVLQEKVEEK